MKMQTSVINLFGAPSSGKSTNAARLFALLKDSRVECELIQEFAKDLTWEDRAALSCQPYVSGKQIWKQVRLINKVQYIITDSPIPLGSFYGASPSLKLVLLEEFNKFNNVNYLLTRTKPYSPNGRNQNASQSTEIHDQIHAYLLTNNIPFTQIPGNTEGVLSILSDLGVNPQC